MIEAILSELASTRSEPQRTQMIQELTRQASEHLGDLIAILQQPGETYWKEAIEVISAIGYPENAPAIPSLIAHASNEDLPSYRQAYQVLVTLGPWIVVPYLLQMEESETLDSFAFGFLADTEPPLEGRAQLIQALADDFDRQMPLLIYIMSKEMKLWGEVVVEVARRVGYPRYAPLLPVLITQAGVANTYGQPGAFNLLLNLGKEAVPFYLELMLEKDQKTREWGYDIWSICDLLAKEQNREAAELCVPAVLYLLSSEDPPGEKQERRIPKYDLLSVLERLGSSSVSSRYALPVLLDLIKKGGADGEGERARKLLATYSKEELEPYKLVLDALDEERKEP